MKSFKLCFNETPLFINIINTKDNPCINNELLTDLYNTKCKIDNINLNKWEKYKKLNNDYEYIYTSSNKIYNMSNINPISRSYFKLSEILKDYNINNLNNIACIAEGPGGFINCLLDLKSTNISGITLLSNDKRIPFWSNKLLNLNDLNINKLKNTGDIYIKRTTINFINKIKNKCNLITSDGGFDYSNNFNKQELSSYKLIYCEIFIALNIQNNNGNFIIKVFDLFYHKTIQLIYLLFLSYDEIYIYKPTISRLSNSEKYIVCKGFKGFNKEIIDALNKYYDNVDDLFIELPEKFIDIFNEYNNIFVQNQINYIKNILKFNVKNINSRVDDQIKLSYDWCVKYGIPINNECIYLK